MKFIILSALSLLAVFASADPLGVNIGADVGADAAANVAANVGAGVGLDGVEII